MGGKSNFPAYLHQFFRKVAGGEEGEWGYKGIPATAFLLNMAYDSMREWRMYMVSCDRVFGRGIQSQETGPREWGRLRMLDRDEYVAQKGVVLFSLTYNCSSNRQRLDPCQRKSCLSMLPPGNGSR